MSTKEKVKAGEDADSSPAVADGEDDKLSLEEIEEMEWIGRIAASFAFAILALAALGLWKALEIITSLL